MDAYKKLKLEFKGVKSVIENYADGGNVANYLYGMENALINDDVESVLYLLNEICIWYQDNINDIHNDTYVYDMHEHDRNMSLLEGIKKDLDNYDFNKIFNEDNNKIKTQNIPKIFISHRSTDKKYGDALEKLIVGLGVKNEQLIYSSHPLHKIPLNENIYNYLRKNINQKVFVIILWSNDYLESPACLNEMGAAWVTQSDYINIYTPDFSIGNPKYHECAVDTRKMGAVLNGDTNCKASMIEFKDKILEMFNLTLDEQTWTYLLDQFIAEIK